MDNIQKYYPLLKERGLIYLLLREEATYNLIDQTCNNSKERTETHCMWQIRLGAF